MYKRFVLVLTAMLVVSSPLVYAEDQAPLMLTDEQIAGIKSNCVSVQSTLNRIHSNDALSRVHLGQEYETISTKFMAPMNSRIALAKLDSVALTKTTVEFNTKLGEFRSLYQQYEQTLLRAIQTKCIDEPVSFYDTIVVAQSHRADVRESVIGLGNLVTQYRNHVKALKPSALATKPAEESKK